MSVGEVVSTRECGGCGGRGLGMSLKVWATDKTSHFERYPTGSSEENHTEGGEESDTVSN